MPSLTAFSRSINSTDAAPSLICEELPAVTEPRTLNAGRNLPKISSVVSALTPSSCVKVIVSSCSLLFAPTVRNVTSTGTVSSAKFPAANAFAAR